MNYRDFQERKKFERFLYSGWSIFVVFVLLALSLAGIAKLWTRDRDIRAEIEELQIKLSEAKTASESGREKLRNLGAPDGIDLEARGRFNLKKEGEELVVFLDSKSVPEERGGFWEKAQASPTRIWQNLKNWLGL